MFEDDGAVFRVMRAGARFLSPKTARNYVSNILTKLHVTDRTEAIIRAHEAGLG